MQHISRAKGLLSGAARVQASHPWLRGVSNASDHSDASAPPSDVPEVVEATIRVDLLAQQAAYALASGRALAGRRRPDLQMIREEEAEHLGRVKDLAPRYGVRPSLLGPLVAAGFAAIGAASAAAPPRLAAAAAAGISDALTDTFNEQLRAMHEAGVAEGAAEVRALVRGLRDQERAPAGAPSAPDITALRNPRALTPAEGVAAVFKAGTRLLLDAAKKV